MLRCHTQSVHIAQCWTIYIKQAAQSWPETTCIWGKSLQAVAVLSDLITQCVSLYVWDLTRIFSALSEKTDSQGGLLPSSQSGSSNCKIEDSEKTNILSIYDRKHWAQWLISAWTFSLLKKTNKIPSCRTVTLSSYISAVLYFKGKNDCSVKQTWHHSLRIPIQQGMTAMWFRVTPPWSPDSLSYLIKHSRHMLR